MTIRIKGHFDGQTIVPDEPVDWPAGTSVTVEFAGGGSRNLPVPSRNERLAALRRIATRATNGQAIPDGSFRRENIYGDEGR